MLKCLFGHKWSKYTDVVDTGNHIYKAQFKSCTECNLIKVKYIKSMYGSSIAELNASVMNENLTTKEQ